MTWAWKIIIPIGVIAVIIVAIAYYQTSKMEYSLPAPTVSMPTSGLHPMEADIESAARAELAKTFPSSQ